MATNIPPSNANNTFGIQIDLATVYAKWSKPSYQMHKLSPQMRMVAQHDGPSVYDPMMVSLGPYHHGKPELHQAEEFKYLCLDWCSGGSETKKSSLYEMILNTVDKIRSCYAEVSKVEYDDKVLALMMLLDACFILNFMEYCCGKKRDRNRVNCIGVEPTLNFTARDMLVLENQIPFFVLKLLINELYGTEDGKDFVQKFFGFFGATGLEKVAIPREDEDPPIHFLDVCRRVMIEKQTPELHAPHQSFSYFFLSFGRFKWPSFLSNLKRKNMKNSEQYSSVRSACRSVMDLKAKGIKICPSSSHSYKDVKFHSRTLYGELQLPIGKVSIKTRVNLSNMIAFETSPHGPAPVVLSYVILMKSLIQTAADVKELQVKGIFKANRFADPDEVVQLFKSINTLGIDTQISIHKDVMQRVGEHCNNKAKTWMADLIRGNLKNPWTLMALLAAILVILLTIMQTYYAMNPVK